MLAAHVYKRGHIAGIELTQLFYKTNNLFQVAADLLFFGLAEFKTAQFGQAFYGFPAYVHCVRLFCAKVAKKQYAAVCVPVS